MAHPLIESNRRWAADVSARQPEGTKIGLIDNWLRHVQDVRSKHRALVEGPSEQTRRFDRLCELNVIEQALHVCETTIVQDAWARDQSLMVQAWIYSLADGRLRDLGFSAASVTDMAEIYPQALSHITAT